jgi:hypothetical protein
LEALFPVGLTSPAIYYQQQQQPIRPMAFGRKQEFDGSSALLGGMVGGGTWHFLSLIIKFFDCIYNFLVYLGVGGAIGAG